MKMEGTKINKEFGKGSILVTTQSGSVGVLTPVTFNGGPDVITLKLPDMYYMDIDPEVDLEEFAELLEDNHVVGNLVLPGEDTGAVAWERAAEFLEELAKAARARAEELKRDKKP